MKNNVYINFSSSNCNKDMVYVNKCLLVVSWFVTWVVSGLVFGYSTDQFQFSPLTVVFLLVFNAVIIYLVYRE